MDFRDIKLIENIINNYKLNNSINQLSKAFKEKITTTTTKKTDDFHFCQKRE